MQHHTKHHTPLAHDINEQLWGYGEDVQEDYKAGYKYAIASSSTAVLSMYRTRCMKHHGDVALCAFHVAYP